jgi:uncharacterized integral membrane protein
MDRARGARRGGDVDRGRIDHKERAMASSAGMSSPDPSGRAPRKKRDRRELVRMGVAVVALILLVAFVLDNSNSVRVGFVFFSTRISLIWVLLIAAFLGALVDRLIILLGQRRRKRTATKPQ